MTPASTGKFTTARVAVILFSACLMGGFVWYSHIKAQPKSGEAEAGAQTTQATILPGSKRSNAAIVPEDIDRLVVNKDGFTIDLNLAEPAGGQSATSSTSEKGMILPSSKLGVFRDVVSSPSPVRESGDDRQQASDPFRPLSGGAPNPPQSEQPVMLPGSKAIARPVFEIKTSPVASPPASTASQETRAATSGTLMLGSKSAPVFSQPSKAGGTAFPVPPTPPKPVQTKATEPSPPSQVSPTPPAQQTVSPPTQSAPIFTSSKSGPIFKTVPQAPSPPAKAQTQAQAPQPPPPAKKVKAKSAPQPKTDTPAPASP